MLAESQSIAQVQASMDAGRRGRFARRERRAVQADSRRGRTPPIGLAPTPDAAFGRRRNRRTRRYDPSSGDRPDRPSARSRAGAGRRVGYAIRNKPADLCPCGEKRGRSVASNSPRRFHRDTGLVAHGRAGLGGRYDPRPTRWRCNGQGCRRPHLITTRSPRRQRSRGRRRRRSVAVTPSRARSCRARGSPPPPPAHAAPWPAAARSSGSP